MLFSFEDFRGYAIRAADGDVGSVDDVLFEDTTSAGALSGGGDRQLAVRPPGAAGARRLRRGRP